MLFVVTAIDKPDSLALRMATREAHFAYARETNVIKLGGPFLNDKQEMAGSLIIFEADDLAAAKAWHAGDPYVKAGLFAHSEVRPWRLTFNPSDVKF
ncbi:MAG: YciI family protein [Alphaproteobacteria bacterium]|nr:YciI family protein [Alphaproteobacteria bacterium]MBV9542727.1 YciI family protein [Alphaproteobacteria bacterium]MBV9903917.1 YciI family protein [Alphaproteobacteria bacterium]